MNAEGDFTVAWTSFGSAGSDQSNGSVQARRYRQDGTPIDGAEFQVNTLTTELQADPALSAGIDGDFVIAWSSAVSAGSDSDEFSVQARRFGRPTLEVTSTSGGTGGPGCTLRDAVRRRTRDSPWAAARPAIRAPSSSSRRAPRSTFQDPDNGSNALPVIQAPVTIRGRGSRIERDPGLACPVDPEFRLVEVAAGGILTLGRHCDLQRLPLLGRWRRRAVERRHGDPPRGCHRRERGRSGRRRGGGCRRQSARLRFDDSRQPRGRFGRRDLDLRGSRVAPARPRDRVGERGGERRRALLLRSRAGARSQLDLLGQRGKRGRRRNRALGCVELDDARLLDRHRQRRADRRRRARGCRRACTHGSLVGDNLGGVYRSPPLP